MKVQLSKSERIIRHIVQHYNEKKYWKWRETILNFSGGA